VNRITFFVGTNGADFWSGKLFEPNDSRTDGPFATITRARDAVRSLSKAERSSKPVSVEVRGGTYLLEEPLCFVPEDSGVEVAPVTYCAYPGERPILSGGRQLTGWKPAGGSRWRASVPPGMRGRAFRQLFVNGSRRCRARIPGDGECYEITGALDPDQPLDENYQDYHQEGNENHKGFRFTPGQIKRWEDLADLEVVVTHPFATTRMRIAELDEAQGIVRFAGPEYIWSYAPPKTFHVENVKEGLTAPGTWHLEHGTGTVTYWPLPDEDMVSAEIIAPALQSLVRFEGDSSAGRFVEHIEISGFTLQHADWVLPEEGFRDPQAATVIPGAIRAEGAVHCSFEKNRIEKIGTYALELGRGCRENSIIGNCMRDLGAGGIKLGETVNRSDDIDETRDTTVTDNLIHDGGKIFPEGVGIWIGQSSGNRIAHNEIRDMHYTGISVGWNWGFTRNRTRDNLIEYNHIHHVMKEKLDDGAAIYTLGISPGSVIRNNLIHNVYGRNYAYGIYLDEGTMGVLVENNVVHHIGWAGIRLQIATSGNIVMNNIIAYCSKAQFGIDTDRANCYLCNIVYWSEGDLFTRTELDDFETVFDHNLYCRTDGNEIDFAGHSFDQWKRLRPRHIRYVRPDPIDANALVADPLFADPENGDFSLPPESPALQLGFRPIDVSGVGPRPDRRM
jgi:parallel beta-helix repeat protein